MGPVDGEPIASAPRVYHSENCFPGKDYIYRDTFDLASSVQAPCGVASVLNIQSELRTSNSNNAKGSGYIATDSVSTSNNIYESLSLTPSWLFVD